MFGNPKKIYGRIFRLNNIRNRPADDKVKIQQFL